MADSLGALWEIAASVRRRLRQELKRGEKNVKSFQVVAPN